MDVRRMHSFPAERFPGARKHRYIRPSDCGHNTSGIRGRLLQGSIPVHGADSQQVQGLVMSSEKNGECILLQALVSI